MKPITVEWIRYCPTCKVFKSVQAGTLTCATCGATLQEKNR